MQLRCTRKVLDQFGIPQSSLFDPASTDATLGNWYVNLVTIDRRKTLIFMSERTLLSFLIFGVRKNNSRNLGEIFVRGLVQLLEMEEFSGRQIESVLGKERIVTLTKTDNRRALGNMNDLQNIYEHKIWYHGGFRNCDLWDVISSTNRMPQRNIGWAHSIDLARELAA
jgi:hypothetical protein